MAFPDFYNWRFNPFTEAINDVQINNEAHTIAFDDETNAYGVRLQEGILLDGSLPFNVNSNYSIVEDITGGATFTEVPRTNPPAAGEMRVDYSNATNYYGTSFIEFNAADTGKTVLCEYRGTGTVVKDRYQLLQQTVVPTNLGVEGDLQITGSADVDTNLNVDGNTTLIGTQTNTGTVTFNGAAVHNGATTLNAATVSTSTIKMNTGATIDEFSTDATLAGDSDTALVTEKAIKAYADGKIDNIYGQDIIGTNIFMKRLSVILDGSGFLGMTAHGISNARTNSRILSAQLVSDSGSTLNATNASSYVLRFDDTNVDSLSTVVGGSAAPGVIYIVYK